MKYDARWFKGLRTQEEKDARVKELNSAQWAFDKLAEVLEGEKQPISHDYDIANWPMKAAHQNGVNKTIDSVLHLLKPRG